MIRIDMDMPKNCYYCRFCHGMEYGPCVLTDEEIDNSLSKDMKRLEWCPLSEIVKCGDITNTIDGTKTAIYIRPVAYAGWRNRDETGVCLRKEFPTA